MILPGGTRVFYDYISPSVGSGFASAARGGPLRCAEAVPEG